MNPKEKTIKLVKKFNLSSPTEIGLFREIIRSKRWAIREDGQTTYYIIGIYY